MLITLLNRPMVSKVMFQIPYVINFVDDYSGICSVYFLKQKSDAVRALKKFLCDVAPYGKVYQATPM